MENYIDEIDMAENPNIKNCLEEVEISKIPDVNSENLGMSPHSSTASNDFTVTEVQKLASDVLNQHKELIDRLKFITSCLHAVEGKDIILIEEAIEIG